MHRSSRNCARALAWAAFAALIPAVAAAQPVAGAPVTLSQAFEAAWQRQPEAASRDARRQAADAARRAASRWLSDAPALDIAAATDRFNRNHGSREVDLALSLPLWLPGERERAGALAEAEGAALDAKLRASRLRVAGAVRDAWWAAQLALLDEKLARDRLANARQLAGDTARRTRAGELARADQFQADGALAQAESALADASAAARSATLTLRALTGALGTLDAPGELAGNGTAGEAATQQAEPNPADAHGAADVPHLTLVELQTRALVSQRTADLAATQTRANPELLLGAKRERGQRSEAFEQSLVVGVRIAFGGGPRGEAKIAGARADALEAQAQLDIERARLRGEIDSARERVSALRSRVAAADRQWQLARELRGFFDKAFKLGEADLPTRLRVELEAVTAERQAARTRIEAAAAVSALRQALGLLPE